MKNDLKINENAVFGTIIKQTDKVSNIALLIYFIFGLGLGFFYDTTLFALGVGGLTVAGYFIAKLLLPGYSLYRFYLSGAYAIFMAQFIYQMHGMFEMHFFAYIGALLLMGYQDWRLQLPNIAVVALHHSVFAWLQYKGVEGVFFTQLEYMDLQTFIIHVLLAVVIVAIIGYYSFVFRGQTLQNAMTRQRLEAQFTEIESNIKFAEQIKEGHADISYTLQNEDDKLGHALMDMQHSLAAANAREQQEKFVSVGLAKINDILRANADNTANLCGEVIKEICKYMKANQAGIYLLEDQDAKPYLELKAHYAYDRKKFANKKIAIGQGLVGQVFLEKKYSLMTNLPNGYMSVTSGLGEATPACLMVIPIQANGLVSGIIEIASFNVFSPYQIAFLEKVVEVIGITLASGRLSEQTKKLLDEALAQGQLMKQQEEQVQHKLEELLLLQEESQYAAQSFASKLEALNNSGIAMIEFTPSGIIKNTNDVFNNVMGYKREEIIGKHHRIFVEPSYAASTEYARFWPDLADGKIKSGEFTRITKSGTKIAIRAGYSAVKDKKGNVESIIKFAVMA